MLRRLRFLIALIAALALPLQATAGVVMLYGGQGGEATMAMAEDDMAMPENCPMRQQSAPAGQQQRCSHCGFCHLAAAGFIPAGEATAPVLRPIETYAAATEATPASHIPEPPQQPPRRLG